MIRSYTTLCDSAIAALGEGAYRVVFSIVSLAVIVWLVMAYRLAFPELINAEYQQRNPELRSFAPPSLATG
jgi:NnrU protein